MSAMKRRTAAETPRWLRLTSSLAIIALLQVQWAGLVQGGDLVANAWAQSAMANSMTVLVVPAKTKDAEMASALERVLARSASRLELVRSFELSPVAGEEEETKAKTLIEEALRALLLRTPKRATERVTAAQALLASQPNAGGSRLFARLAKAQGLIALQKNDLIGARDQITRSLVLFPRQTEEEYVAYGSQAKELFAASKQTLSAAPSGDIEVGKKAAGAEIWVDSVYRGRAPAKIEELVAGEHRVALRLSGMVGDRRFIRVEPGKSTLYDVDLEPASFHDDLESGRKVVAANFGQPSVVEDRIRELRNQIGVDQILVVRASFAKASTTLSGYFLGSDGVFKKVKGELQKNEDYFEEAAKFVASGGGAKLLADPEKAPLDQRTSVVVASETKTSDAARRDIDPNEEMFKTDKDIEDPITKKWWFWTAVGGGVALIGVVGFILASQDTVGPEGATGTVKVNLHKASGN
jgi:hypothetical protein